jgi:predicted lipid-binding transport protein (Tim44 family)
MTPELFDELRGTIASNGDVADFQNLDCQLVDSATEVGRYIASVRFSGQVSESVNATPVPFNETWHYVKDPAGTKWLVAGIQQD